MSARLLVSAALIAVLPAQAFAIPASRGLSDYVHRRDARALRELKGEIANGRGSSYAQMALGDLYLMRGDPQSARRMIEAVASDTTAPLSRSAQVWLTWIDFAHRDRDAAMQSLQLLIRSADRGDQRDEATLMLGWQQLLAGRYDAAAATFHDLGAHDGDGHWLAFPDQALLLEGQALMWSGRLEEARARFEEVEARFGSGNVADDAARDAAWCDHLAGKVEAARLGLEDVDRRYRDAQHRRPNVLRTRWDVVAAGGGPAIAKDLPRAYRTRPRGQVPLEFLLALGDRFAAEDARHLLERLENGATDVAAEVSAAPLAAVRETDPAGDPRRSARGSGPPAPGGSSPQRIFPSRRLLVVSMVSLLAIGALILARRYATRRRKSVRVDHTRTRTSTIG